MHVGQPVVSALEAVGQLFMIEAEQVHDGCLQVVDMNPVFDNTETEFVGLAVIEAGFGTTTSEPHRVAIGVMVTSEDFAFRSPSFPKWSSSEFAAPDDQRIFKQAALLQIFNERCDRFIHRRTFFLQAVTDPRVRSGSVEVPTPVEQLHIAHAGLNKTPGEQAVIRQR